MSDAVHLQRTELAREMLRLEREQRWLAREAVAQALYGLNRDRKPLNVLYPLAAVELAA